ncbi:MAG: SDR family oxidoreductase [Paraglaciecola sp.]|nr:SDR family oxidoreductase [Paraglaciecola sp.]
MDKVAIVSGSTSGIGYFIAKQLLTAGYFVYINGRNKERCDASVTNLKDISQQVSSLVGDINDPSYYTAWISKVKAQHEGISLLVSNVGTGKYPNNDLNEMHIFEQAMQENFISALNFCQGFMDILRPPAAVVLISSIAGIAPLGAPIPYACAKAALNMYMQEQALRYADKGIRFNCISPGNVMFSGSTWDDKINKNKQATLKYIENNVPLNCFVSPQSIANMLVTLANTPELTGQNIVIDGGQIIGKS